MNKELKDWCDRNEGSMLAEPEERKNPMIDFVNRHWLLCNPICVLAYACAILAIVLSLLDK